ncbi:MAG: Arginine N-succinyltransferase [Polyangiaceae bacterium]|jgi:arginine N-succinyltransferase|nr:Arginine N-succinyltransferase [Polyangiaceae bacterium]
MARYEIRGAVPTDLGELLRLARHLNSVNLPHEAGHITRLLETSEKSFTGQIENPRRRKYVFLIRDLERAEAVGTSMIVAQLGRRDAPYIYLDVSTEEKYSSSTDKHFHHRVLRIGFSYDGPTELGGLVVHPEHRRADEKLGLLISYVRFAFIATHRDLFKNELLAELMPPLQPDGTSHLWEAFGRRFTGMSYAEADLRSSEDKTFIRDLFPRGEVYASLLSQDAQDVIGKVGAQTRGVERMLRRVGFRYAERIDPFDGGPHFVASADEVSLIQGTRALPFAGVLGEGDGGAKARALVTRETKQAPYFRAVACRFTEREGQLLLPADFAELLGASPGEPLGLLPLP